MHNAPKETDKCRLSAKSCVFWTGINNDIAKTVNAAFVKSIKRAACDPSITMSNCSY